MKIRSNIYPSVVKDNVKKSISGYYGPLVNDTRMFYPIEFWEAVPNQPKDLIVSVVDFGATIELYDLECILKERIPVPSTFRASVTLDGTVAFKLKTE